MKKTGMAWVLSGIVWTSFAIAGGSPKPLVEVIDAPIPVLAGGAPSLDDIHTAILRGFVDKGWTAQDVEPGVVRGVLTRDDWMAAIDVRFTTHSYSIVYADSRNLDYNAQRHVIHRNFSKWLVYLKQRIDVHLSSGQ